MSYVNWLHLSDWHHGNNSFDRKVIAKKLISDIETQIRRNARLAQIDFVIFSGDISFSGDAAQFDKASALLIDPIRKIVGKEVPLFCVPGNHDIQRNAFSQIPNEWAQTLISGKAQEVEDLLQDAGKVRFLKRPLENFYAFAAKHGCVFDDDKLHAVKYFEKEGRRVGIACLNTAWLSARSNIQPRAAIQFWDRGVLRFTEGQIRDALEHLSGVDIAIATMHHPLHWLEEVEQAKAEQMMGRDCHVILHGHEHRPNMHKLANAFGDVVTIPAGACYYRRIADDPRYTNAYNFCSIDGSNVGTIFHRIWSEEQDTWRADDRFWADGQSVFFIQKKQAREQQKMARKSLNQLSRNYLDYIYKRPAKSHEIFMRHTAETIDGELFVRASVRIQIELHPGDPEPFPIRSLVNPRVVAHSSPKVREAAHKLITLTPQSKELVWSEDGLRCEGTLSLGGNDNEIIYEFEMLDTPDGLYYFNLRRFTEHVKFTLFKDPQFDYEDLPFGGFPSKKSKKDPLMRADTWETYELASPNQGLLLQWYPRRASAVVAAK